MFFTDISPWIISGGALIPLVVGSFWYSSAVFGSHWLRLSGSTIRDERDARRALANAWLGSFAASLIMTTILAVLIDNLFVVSALDGMKVGFYVWLGFIATTTFPEYLFGGTMRPYPLYFIVNGHHLLSLLLTGGFLGIFL